MNLNNRKRKHCSNKKHLSYFPCAPLHLHTEHSGWKHQILCVDHGNKMVLTRTKSGCGQLKRSG